MATITSHNGIPIRGKQRTAVYNALKEPATGRQILALAKESAPSMTYQDLRHILRDFQKMAMVTCLNPDCQTGRIYAVTSVQADSLPSSGLIDIYAQVDRAKTRLAVLKAVSKKRFFDTEPLTATRIKRLLRDHHPMSLNHVLAGLKFLEEKKLVEITGRTDKRELKIYKATDLGKNLLHYFIKGTDSTDCTPHVNRVKGQMQN